MDRLIERLMNAALGDILEIGAFWSIRTKDVPSFDRYFSQLQTFYTDYRYALSILIHLHSESSISTVLPPSPREYPLLGLNLIRLLTQNRIADFHTTLESLRLPAEEVYENPYIKHPVNVECWLMEGSYSKVWNAREEAPAEEYKFFVDSLMGTIRCGTFSKHLIAGNQLTVIRNEIASCQVAAYDSLPLKDAATLLFFTNRQELLSFAQQVCDASQQFSSF